MSVLITMRVKVHDFEGTRKAAQMFAANARTAGCHWAKVYRSENDPNDVLWLMEWESHEAFNKSGDDTGEDFNALVDPASDWEDVVWHLSDAPPDLAFDHSSHFPPKKGPESQNAGQIKPNSRYL